jgi:PAS domain S-box-containing protein
MAIAQAGGRIVRVNTAWRALLGYEPEGLPGRSLLELVHPADRDAAIACWQRVVAGRASDEVTCRIRMARGGGRSIRWKVSLDPDSGRVRLAGRDRDEVVRVTEIMEHIGSIIEGVPKPIFSTDETLVVRHVNAAACRVFGYGSGELLGRSLDLLLPGLSDLIASDTWSEPSSAGDRAPLRVERTGVRKDQERFPVMVSVTETSSGLGRSLVVVARDLTQDQLDHARTLDEARALEASAMQVRLADELHDGLLQSLTGASLQLEIIQNLFRQDPTGALDRLLALR